MVKWMKDEAYKMPIFHIFHMFNWFDGLVAKYAKTN